MFPNLLIKPVSASGQWFAGVLTLSFDVLDLPRLIKREGLVIMSSYIDAEKHPMMIYFFLEIRLCNGISVYNSQFSTFRNFFYVTGTAEGQTAIAFDVTACEDQNIFLCILFSYVFLVHGSSMPLLVTSCIICCILVFFHLFGVVFISMNTLEYLLYNFLQIIIQSV